MPARQIGTTGGTRLRDQRRRRSRQIDCDVATPSRRWSTALPRPFPAAGIVESGIPRGHHVDKFKDECGVFGIFGHPEAANLTYLGLYALQHRGQESAGIATGDGEKMRVSRAMGHVADAFTGNVLEGLPGHLAIGHTRYSTAGESRLQNAQPMLIDCAHGQIAIAHNGNIVNARELRDELVRNGSIFQTSSDTEVVAASLRAVEGRLGRRGADRVGHADQRRVLVCAPDEEPADRGARSAWLPPAGARQAGRRLDRLLGNLRARPDRRHLRARRRARRSRWSSATAGCAHSIRSRRRRCRTASSSTSTSPGPTATCSAAA